MNYNAIEEVAIVPISVYKRLLERDEELSHMEWVGVNNWDGIQDVDYDDIAVKTEKRMMSSIIGIEVPSPTVRTWVSIKP